jgi:hypothetical protein
MLFSVRSSNLPDSVVSHRASIVEKLGSAYYHRGGKLTYEVVRLSSLGLNTNSFDSPPTVDGWVSYNDLISALSSNAFEYMSLQFKVLDIANRASQLIR